VGSQDPETPSTHEISSSPPLHHFVLKGFSAEALELTPATDVPLGSSGVWAIRVAEMGDVPAMVALRAPGDEEGVPSAERMTGYLTGKHSPQRALQPRVVLLAETAGHVVGYIAGHRTQRFDCDGELEWLYVAAEHRRQGVATALLHRLSSWFVAQDARRICVNVASNNLDARAFYRARRARPLSAHWLVWDDVRQMFDPCA
jgi:GNAT superfamily N-acetyltransferase